MATGARSAGDVASLWVLVAAFPALSFPVFLVYLRARRPGVLGSWILLAGAFLLFLFAYRHACHERHLCLNAGLMEFARCTIILAWYLRLMLGVAVCLTIAPAQSPGRTVVLPNFDF